MQRKEGKFRDRVKSEQCVWNIRRRGITLLHSAQWFIDSENTRDVRGVSISIRNSVHVFVVLEHMCVPGCVRYDMFICYSIKTKVKKWKYACSAINIIAFVTRDSTTEKYRNILYNKLNIFSKTRSLSPLETGWLTLSVIFFRAALYIIDTTCTLLSWGWWLRECESPN